MYGIAAAVAMSDAKVNCSLATSPGRADGARDVCRRQGGIGSNSHKADEGLTASSAGDQESEVRSGLVAQAFSIDTFCDWIESIVVE